MNSQTLHERVRAICPDASGSPVSSLQTGIPSSLLHYHHPSPSSYPPFPNRPWLNFCVSQLAFLLFPIKCSQSVQSKHLKIENRPWLSPTLALLLSNSTESNSGHLRTRLHSLALALFLLQPAHFTALSFSLQPHSTPTLLNCRPQHPQRFRALVSLYTRLIHINCTFLTKHTC